MVTRDESVNNNKQMLQTCTKIIQYEAWLYEKRDSLGMVQEIKIWTCLKIIYVQENESHKILWDTNGSVNLSQKTRPNKKKSILIE